VQSNFDLLRPSVGPPVLIVPWFCALYALAVWTSTRWFSVGLLFVAVTDLAPAHVGSIDANTVSVIVPFTVVTVVVMILLRGIVATREHRLQIAERERDVLAREAVVAERARIAREMHDVIAHHVSMMVIQAGAERRMLDSEHAATAEVLRTIERIGRDALTEMRRLVGMLRDADADALAPQPGIAEVPILVEQIRSSGLQVDLGIAGEPIELPPGIGLSAYRIVQEGLTNALEHASGSRAIVRITYGRDQLELEINDSGGTAKTSVTNGGHGLVGIHERVALYGGTIDVGQRTGGGFGIRVLLPVR
jgi:signal transduction histidine kinase